MLSEGTVFSMRKWELSLLIGVVAARLWCAAPPHLVPQWWTTAFSPLCDGILGAGAGGGEIVLRSKLWEALSQYVF